MVSHAVLALVIFSILLFLVAQSPRLGVPLCFVYLAVLGGMRRWLIADFGWLATDPLMLVGPAVVAACFGSLLLSRRWRLDTRLARLLGWLLLLMVLQIFNPLQGGLTVGMAGALFYIVPLMWYYIGRTVARPAVVKRVFGAVVVVALSGAVYGLYQHWFGFSAGEQEWLRITRTAQLIGSTPRPFSFFTSPAEYGQCLAVGIVVLWTAWLSGNRAGLPLISLPAVALFLLGIRGAVIGVVVTCAMLWAVRSRSRREWVPRGALALVIGGCGMVWSLNQVQDTGFAPRTQAIVQHQKEGLLNPLGENSSAYSHFNLVTVGVVGGFARPFGLGLGATTLATRKFGGTGASTELDLTNLFLSLGAAGGVLYTVILGVVLAMAFRWWRLTRSPTSLTIVGILVISLGNWLNGGHYSMSMLTMFCIGALDRAWREAGRKMEQMERAPAADELTVRAYPEGNQPASTRADSHAFS